jgi:hypothetical protein
MSPLKVEIIDSNQIEQILGSVKSQKFIARPTLITMKLVVFLNFDLQGIIQSVQNNLPDSRITLLPLGDYDAPRIYITTRELNGNLLTRTRIYGDTVRLDRLSGALEIIPNPDDEFSKSYRLTFVKP